MTIALKRLIEDLIGAYSEEAPKEQNYPYKVFSLHRLNTQDDKQIYSLEVNVWDKSPYYSRCESIMDEVEEILDYGVFQNDKVYFSSYKGDRQNIEDADKQIKRTMETFVLHFYDKE